MICLNYIHCWVFFSRTQWLSDEYTKGAFSYISTYNEPGDTEEMFKPLPSEEVANFLLNILENLNIISTHFSETQLALASQKIIN